MTVEDFERINTSRKVLTNGQFHDKTTVSPTTSSPLPDSHDLAANHCDMDLAIYCEEYLDLMLDLHAMCNDIERSTSYIGI